MAGRCRIIAFLLAAATCPSPAAANGEAAGAASEGCVAQVWIPPNVTIENAYAFAVANEMACRSGTFRNRLLQIAAARTVRVRVRTGRLRSGTTALAQTAFAFNARGWLFARVQIPHAVLFSRQNVMMIAHEFEHVIEQMEGLDLRSLARGRGTGVHRLGLDHTEGFETDRATAFGYAVQRELGDALLRAVQ